MSKLTISTGTYHILPNNISKDKTIKSARGYTHCYDFRFRKEEPSYITKWLRRNLGERGNGYDFTLNFKSGTVEINIFNDKLNFIYEIWVK